MWKVYAILSALFAALTAIFAKVGVKDVNSDLATAIRTSVILVLTWGIVLFGQHVSEIREVSKNTWIFLVLSGLATGLSWLFFFKAIQLGDVSRVAPIDKLSVVITILLAFIFLHEQVNLRVRPEKMFFEVIERDGKRFNRFKEVDLDDVKDVIVQ